MAGAEGAVEGGADEAVVVLVGAAALVVVAADGVGAVAAGAGAPGGVAAGVGMLPVDEVLSDLKNCSLLLCSCNRE